MFQLNQTLKYVDWFELIYDMGLKARDYQIPDETMAKVLTVRYAGMYSKY